MWALWAARTRWTETDTELGVSVQKHETRLAHVQSLFPEQEADAVARFFRVPHNRTVAFEPLSAIFPGHIAPVVRQSADGNREIVTMNWGFVLHQKERAPRRVTNVRDDKILESRFWRGSFEERRCLVPATQSY